ncbi:cysteine dioxygenase type 1 isoform X2 [Hetaerina americana]|uniref:cysteine dioxygenase type 1 isoform X2 n=1 Tax=Hetaerina americana TaxID=62018 RepID=UPI003A7F4683
MQRFEPETKALFHSLRYTRNLVDAGNGKFNLMILCWGEGHGSAIHDHADAHCFMKMLQGTLSEIRFAWPEQESDEEHNAGDITGHGPTDGEGLKETGRSQLKLNDVCYINDSLGLHRVENPSHTEAAVSLHLYCPPFDACSVFNQQTGRKSVAKVTFWSKYGEKTSGEEKVAASQPEDN